MSSPSGSDPASAPPPVIPSLASIIGVLHDNKVVSYTNIGFLVILLYDHAITFDIEVAKIWTLPWRLPKFLFLINRYIIPPMLMFDGITPAIPNLPRSVCVFIGKWTTWPTMIALGTVEIMLILRVLALYSHSKMMGRFLVGLFTCEMIAWLVLSCLILTKTTVLPANPIFPGCLFSAPRYFYVSWIPPVLFESAIIVLTMYKILRSAGLGPTLRLLARDSLVYFVLMFSVLFANLMISRFGKDFLGALLIGPSSVIACVAAARMMMNIRELVYDDPDESRHELPTINFRKGSAPASSESGEATVT